MVTKLKARAIGNAFYERGTVSVQDMSSLPELIEQLRSENLLPTPEAQGAFSKVDLRVFVDKRYASLAYEDVPLPYHEAGDKVGHLPSPRLAAAVLQLLDVEEGSDILLVGSEGGYLAALAFELSKGGRVLIVEEDDELAETTRRGLDRSGYAGRIGLADSLPEDSWSRIYVTDPSAMVPERLKHRLGDMGVLVHWRRDTEGYCFLKLVRSRDEFIELAISEVGFLTENHRTVPFNFSALLALEDLLGNVWRGRASTRRDSYFQELADSTFAGGPWDSGGISKEDTGRLQIARRAFRLAHICQMHGDLKRAERLYKKSIEAFPTAESHTFLGWTYSFTERLEEAIEECKRAIAVDSSLGNPYNDIGAYLIQLGHLDDAIPWLKKASEARRYCCYFYPHCNLGRVYMMKGDLYAAKMEFERALEINPGYEFARELLKETERRLATSDRSI